MTTTDVLRLHLRLLILQHGRRGIIEALASISNNTPEQVDAEISAFDAKKRATNPKKEQSVEELINALPNISRETKAILLQLGRLYEGKQFLPTLRDAGEFLFRNDGKSPKFRNRREALGAVLKTAALMPSIELDALLRQTTSAEGKTDFGLLADQLMGKERQQ